jgi:hypothetical protein
MTRIDGLAMPGQLTIPGQSSKPGQKVIGVSNRTVASQSAAGQRWPVMARAMHLCRCPERVAGETSEQKECSPIYSYV